MRAVFLAIFIKLCAVDVDIPVSVLIVTRNEAHNLARCLAALSRFDEVIVIDSQSDDGTCDIARSFNVSVTSFVWNGTYPKKRQWCLDHLTLKHDRVFFIDADEMATPELCDEIAALDWHAPGYFIKGRYVVDDVPLRFGPVNNKLCLFDRRRMMFPVIDDLTIPGIGEIEGHYQPVFRNGQNGKVGKLKQSVSHYATENLRRYKDRHDGYLNWRAGVIKADILPNDPTWMRCTIKSLINRMPFKRLFYFIYFYIFKLGLLERKKNLEIYRETAKYYRI